MPKRNSLGKLEMSMSSDSVKKPLYRRPLFWVVCLILLPVAVYGTMWASTAWSVNQKLDELRAAGLPTNTSELNDFYVVPEGQTDTTEIWMAAIRSVAVLVEEPAAERLPFIGRGEPPVATEDWPELSAAREFLASATDQLALIHEAASAGGAVRFPVDFSAGVATDLPNTELSRSVVRLLVLDAHVNARGGNAEIALQDIIAVFTLSDILQSEPSLLSQLFRLANYSTGCHAVQNILPVCDWNDSQLARLQSAISIADFKHSLQNAMLGERAIVLSAIDESPLMFLHPSNKKQALELFERTTEAADLSWSQSIEHHKNVAAVQSKNKTGWIRLSTLVADLLAPATARVTTSMTRAAGKQNSAITAIAVVRYRLQNGSLPEVLTALVPEQFPAGTAPLSQWMTDPFNDETLRYSKSDKAVTIYSVGSNRTDDDGDLEAERATPLDVGVRLTLQRPDQGSGTTAPAER